MRSKAICGVLKPQLSKASESLYRLDKGNRFELSGETSGKWSRAKVIDEIGWIYTPYIIKDWFYALGCTVRSGAFPRLRLGTATALANMSTTK